MSARRLIKVSKTRPLIYHLNCDEQGICKALYRTGAMTVEDAKKYFSVSDRRFTAMIKENYLERHGELIRLGNKGRKYCEHRLDMKHCYRSKAITTYHDLKLNKLYLRLNENQRETWKTEGQILFEVTQNKDMFEKFRKLKESQKWEKNRVNFTVDAAVYSEKHYGYVAVESITKNYTKQDISQKEAFSNLFFKEMITL